MRPMSDRDLLSDAVRGLATGFQRDPEKVLQLTEELLCVSDVTAEVRESLEASDADEAS